MTDTVTALFESDRNQHVHPSMRPFLNWIGRPQVAHLITRESTGCGLQDTLRPVCSCGWKGSPVEGWRDDQMIQVAAQETQHKFSGVSVQQMREGGVL